MKIKTLIVDDEPLARRRIRQLLEPETDFEVVGEAGDVEQALAAFNKVHPDLVFLDIEMPDGSGFSVVENLPENFLPIVIFVTAYDQYTLKAFDLHAVDYLLKPVDEVRFRQALARVREKIVSGTGRELSQKLADLLGYLQLNQKYLERLIINHKNRLIIVPTKDIDWITAYGNYLKVYSRGKTYLMRETLANLASKLSPEQFVQIHRSTVVNFDQIKELHPMFGGQYTVIMRDGTELTLSRTFRKKVLDLFTP